MTPSPGAPDENNDNFLGMCYRVDVEKLMDGATVTRIFKGSLAYVFQEPGNADNFQQFFIIMCRLNWEIRVLAD